VTAVNADELAHIRATARALGLKAGIADERARIKAILHAEEARERVEMARYLAFETDTAPDAAVALLARAPKGSPSDHPHANALQRAIEACQSVRTGPDDSGIVDVLEPDVPAVRR
jgi:glutathione S-transferase